MQKNQEANWKFWNIQFQVIEFFNFYQLNRKIFNNDPVRRTKKVTAFSITFNYIRFGQVFLKIQYPARRTIINLVGNIELNTIFNFFIIIIPPIVIFLLFLYKLFFKKPADKPMSCHYIKNQNSPQKIPIQYSSLISYS